MFHSFVIEPEKQIEVETDKRNGGDMKKINWAPPGKGRIFAGLKNDTMGGIKPAPGPLLGRRGLFAKPKK